MNDVAMMFLHKSYVKHFYLFQTVLNRSVDELYIFIVKTIL